MLDAIFAAPREDGPRLVYADFLMEQQDPRGDFIRMQCDAAALPVGPQRNELEQRAAELLHHHKATWAPGGLEWRFVRGFPATVKLAASVLQANAALLESVPTFEGLELNFHGVTEALAAVWVRQFRLPVFQRCRSLRLTWHVPATVVLALTEQAWLSKLESLQVSWVSLGPPAWKALGECTALRNLKTLDLGLSGATDETFVELSALPWPWVQKLRLSNNQLGTRTCEVLARSKAWSGVKHLDLSWNRVGKRGGAALAASELISHLETLDFSHDQVGDETCVALALAQPKRLKWLGLTQSRVSERGLVALSRAMPELVVRTQ
jgi:uncharacterized protein (TIGR02996 family)